MTSEERREARYQRRRAKREARKAARNTPYDNFELVFSYEHLYTSYRKCRRGVSWKASVQKFIANAPLEVYRIHQRLQSGKYRSPGFYEFDLFERGKKRHIRSTVIGERVVQRTLCDYSLVPVLQGIMIHDNGATMPRKGYDFAARRFRQHLEENRRRHPEGWVLMFDFTSFFDNVDHGVLDRILRSQFTDQRLLALTDHLIGMFGTRGLGLGSQISQVLALASATELDHVIKEKLQARGYGRYMDDGYVLCESKEQARARLEVIKTTCENLGIILSARKTYINKAIRATWLKTRYTVLPSGRIVRKIYPRSVTVQRRKLKALRRLLDAGKVELRDVFNSYEAWDGYARRFDSYTTRQNMRRLYFDLFGEELMEIGLY